MGKVVILPFFLGVLLAGPGFPSASEYFAWSSLMRMLAFLVAVQTLVRWVYRLKKEGRVVRVEYFHNGSGLAPLMVSNQSSQSL